MILAIVIGCIAAVLLSGACLAPIYFFNLASGRKDPMPGTAAFHKAKTADVQSEAALREPKLWLDTMPCEDVNIRSRDGLTLGGYYLERTKRAGTVIIAHGYTTRAKGFSSFAQYFYEQLGYNVLLPNARGYGNSEGKYIGFGWQERLDYLDWIDWVKTRTGTAGTARIVLFGVSMGAATVMMTGGEALPPEVKAIIEDCGYTSVEDELIYQGKTTFHLNLTGNSPLFKAINRQAEKHLGYSFKEASSLEQVKKIKVPTLFIHGEADTFVPTKMVYPLYEACAAPKELYVVPGAGHGKACQTDPAEYEKRVSQFLEKYVQGGC
ncbi:alpha/beta hydrolase [Spirochaetia bacterium]|nr:alpha/beta hydrolase [Spirochaetia bacterium]